MLIKMYPDDSPGYSAEINAKKAEESELCPVSPLPALPRNSITSKYKKKSHIKPNTALNLVTFHSID